jgi:hypothetical protein
MKTLLALVLAVALCGVANATNHGHCNVQAVRQNVVVTQQLVQVPAAQVVVAQPQAIVQYAQPIVVAQPVVHNVQFVQAHNVQAVRVQNVRQNSVQRSFSRTVVRNR